MRLVIAIRTRDKLRHISPRTPEQEEQLKWALETIESSYPEEGDYDWDDDWIVGRNGAAYDTFRI